MTNNSLDNFEQSFMKIINKVEPVILLRPEDMHARLNHQLTMRSYIDLKYTVIITMNGNI